RWDGAVRGRRGRQVMRRVGGGFWGPRQESAEELAARWCTTMEHLARLLPTAGAAVPASDTAPGAPAGGGPLTIWRTVPASGRPADVLRLPHPDRAAPGEEFRESLLRAVRSAQEDDGWSAARSEEHTSELQSRENLVCR